MLATPRWTTTACDTAIPNPITRASSRPAATALSHLTAIHRMARPSTAFRHRCWDAAPPRKASSMMIRAPARAIAATPSIHASSSTRNPAMGDGSLGWSRLTAKGRDLHER